MNQIKQQMVRDWRENAPKQEESNLPWGSVCKNVTLLQEPLEWDAATERDTKEGMKGLEKRRMEKVSCAAGPVLKWVHTQWLPLNFLGYCSVSHLPSSDGCFYLPPRTPFQEQVDSVAVQVYWEWQSLQHSANTGCLTMCPPCLPFPWYSDVSQSKWYLPVHAPSSHARERDGNCFCLFKKRPGYAGPAMNMHDQRKWMRLDLSKQLLQR